MFIQLKDPCVHPLCPYPLASILICFFDCFIPFSCSTSIKHPLLRLIITAISLDLLVLRCWCCAPMGLKYKELEGKLVCVFELIIFNKNYWKYGANITQPFLGWCLGIMLCFGFLVNRVLLKRGLFLCFPSVNYGQKNHYGYQPDFTFYKPRYSNPSINL